jgi:uncharacterized protein YraI
MRRPAGIGLVRFAMLMGAGILAVMLFAAPPQSQPAVTHADNTAGKETVEVTMSTGPGYGSVITPTTLVPEMTAALEGVAVEEAEVGRVHWTSRGVEVRIGPSSDYVVIAQLPTSARLQIVGRDATSKWIAIVFAPFTGLNGWIEASAVAGQLDVAGLEIAPVTLLKLDATPSIRRR